MSVIRYQPPSTTRGWPIRQFRDFGSFEKILLLADEDVSRVIRYSLEQNFFEVHVSKAGIDALAEIMAHDFQVIVFDTSVRQFPFEMFYGALEKMRPNLLSRLVFLIDSETDPKVLEFIERVDGLKVWRPIELKELFQIIEIVLGRKPVESSGE